MSFFTQQLEATRQRVFALMNRAAGTPGPPRLELESAFDELANALEELQAAELELREQNQGLIHLQQALDAEQRRYRDLFQFAPDAYLVTNLRGIIQEANQTAAELLNMPGYFLKDTPLLVLVDRDDRNRYSEQLSRLPFQADLDRVTGWGLRLRPRQRPPIQASITLTVVRDHDQRPTGLLWLLRDVTALKEAERLAAIGQMVAGLAHESRNALQRSQSCLEMLALEVRDRPRARDLIGRLQQAQNDLQHLYESVQQFAAPIRLDRQPCRLSQVWRDAWDRLDLQRRGRRVHLREEVSGTDVCRGDPFRLRQVFRNILENTLAACSDPVEILIRCNSVEDHGQPFVQVAVSDNGPGVTPELREKVFEPFYTTKLHGTGLGLAVVKRIMAAHGGEVQAGPSPLGGLEMVLLLPEEKP